MFSQNLSCSADGGGIGGLVPSYFLVKICARSNSKKIVDQISLVTGQFELRYAQVGFELDLKAG